MKKQKTLKRTVSAVVAAAIMTSVASAQVVYEQDFDNVTQYDLFGNVFNYTNSNNSAEGDNISKNLFQGEEITNEDGSITIKMKDYGTGELLLKPDTLSGRDSVSFFSIENGKGVITKVGGEFNGEYYGFKKNFSEDIKALNKNDGENTETENEEITETENVMKSGVWNFDFKLQSMSGYKSHLVFSNGTAEKLALELTKWPNQIKIADAVANIGSTGIGMENIDNDNKNFGYMLFAGNGMEYQLRFQLNFDTNSLQIYRWFGNTWKQITRIPQYDEDGKTITGYDDECGINLTDFGVDLKNGIDSFGYRECYHDNPCRLIIDDLEISNNSDSTVLWNCGFDDETKDSWWDYGFENYTRKETAWIEDGKLNYSMENGRDFHLDKKLEESANSGVWSVTVKYQSETTDGTGRAPASHTDVGFLSFINEQKGEGETIENITALGLSCSGYPYPHAWKIRKVNDVDKNVYINENLRKYGRPDGNNVMAVDYLNGAEIKTVIDFSGSKPVMYMYTKADYNNREWTTINPNGYELPEGFSFNKIRLYDYNRGGQKQAAWDYIKIEKFDGTDEVVITNDADGGYIGTDSVNIKIESYRTPSEESKTTYIDKTSVNVAAAVYDGNKLVDLKFIPNVQYSVFEEFNAKLKFDTMGNENTVKLFAVEPNGLRPLSKVTNLTGISFDD